MASRTRGQATKRDVVGRGFLNHVTTRAIVPTKYEAVYYRVLGDLGFAELECDRQIIAWQIAYTACRLYEAMDESIYLNDADRNGRIDALERIPKLQKSLIDLINAFNGKRREQPQPTEGETDDLQAILKQLTSGENAS